MLQTFYPLIAQIDKHYLQLSTVKVISNRSVGSQRNRKRAARTGEGESCYEKDVETSSYFHHTVRQLYHKEYLLQ